MAKSTLNPMETYRREQKKKEVKKHRAERQKEKKEKLKSMDSVALKEQLKLLERQMAVNTSTDGPSRKRKQELEDTLRAVAKRQKEMEEEKNEHREKLTGASIRPAMSMTELMQRNREKFENPENSIYYHPTLNPFGAPPPGKPQMYRHAPQPVCPMALSGNNGHGRYGQDRHPERPQQRKFLDGPPVPKIERRFQRPPPAKMQHPRASAIRPGKRPPLPLDPPPPGTIQVPCRPPLPSGAIPVRPPPPPPALTQSTATISMPPAMLLRQPGQEMLSSLVPSASTAAVDDDQQEAAAAVDDDQQEAADEDKVMALYPATDEHDTRDERVVDEDAAERRAQVCSLVPVALRVHRQVPPVTPSSTAIVGRAPSISARCRTVPAPCTSVLQPALSKTGIAPSLPRRTTTTTATANVSMSKEYDSFIEDMKELL
ncbi:unnamed protein product [Hyaloperonospora brassicae]|uniref:Wbp11/ELF5/Saf1 N-terminal domain-containing protein n=1 Tax=Hyaloperonospora brassicae TaxID=162125 RepID=A0AAV0UG26_HYABA|nr:unnamed protein product [Hyaloperonospora brassicae]